MCTELWKQDENRLTPNKDYKINLQGGTSNSLHGNIIIMLRKKIKHVYGVFHCTLSI